MDALIACLKYSKLEKRPVLIHVMTKKGKGYAPAESNPEKFHGIGPFDAKTGTTPPAKESYSKHFGRTLTKMAAENDKITAVTGAMPSGTGLEAFASEFPKRFFDVGIAEQHGVTMSAGLAAGGYIPVIPLYSSFMQRAYDQVLHDVCLQNLHVIFPVDRAGIVGRDGETHQGIYDVAFLSHMPNMRIFSPLNYAQLDEMLEYAVYKCSGPVAIRYPRGSDELGTALPPFDGYGSVTLRKGSDVSIIAAGRMAIRAAEAADMLAERGIKAEVLLLTVLKPLDEAAIIAAAMKTGYAVTIEDNVKPGGIGETAAAILKEHGVECELKIFAVPDRPVPHGSVAELDELCGLDADYIVKEVLNGKNKT